jgi:PiT family inorganic phosphate transporter
MILIYLSSGVFLGWTLGANDAANVFGTAVGSKMIRFRTAALICSVFVILGAVVSGAGASETLGELGEVNAIAGAFIVAGAAGLSVFWMSKLKLPVSTSHAIVGAIIGWNIYTGSTTNPQTLVKITSTWILCPVLAAGFAMMLYLLFRQFFNRARIHLLKLDLYTRLGLIVVGAFGAFSLGANNIANVMGVFVSASPFRDIEIFGLLTFSGRQQLFFIGGVAIAIGVYSYSERIMHTVGRSLFRLSPEAALIVVFAHALVLFIFSSKELAELVSLIGLPPIPLVPVSSTQAVIGAIVGIGLLKNARNINYKMLGEIAIGWVATPLAAGVIAFVALFFLENVFLQEVGGR